MLIEMIAGILSGFNLMLSLKPHKDIGYPVSNHTLGNPTFKQSGNSVVGSVSNICRRARTSPVKAGNVCQSPPTGNF